MANRRQQTWLQVSFHHKFVLLLIAATDDQEIFRANKPQELFKPICLPCLLYSRCGFYFFKRFFRFSFCRFQSLDDQEWKIGNPYLKAEQHLKKKDLSLYLALPKLPVTAQEFFFKLIQKKRKDKRNAMLKTQTFSDASIVFCSFLEENLFLS